MRLTEVLHKAPRKKAIERLSQHKKFIGPYRHMQVPVLKDRVAIAPRRQKEMPCQQHFGVLMQCWKDVDFQEGLCSQEAERFQECMTIYQKNALKEKEKELRSELDGTWQKADRLSTAQANILLKKFPTPKYEFIITHTNRAPLSKPLVFSESDEKNLHTSHHKRLWKEP